MSKREDRYQREREERERNHVLGRQALNRPVGEVIPRNELEGLLKDVDTWDYVGKGVLRGLLASYIALHDTDTVTVTLPAPAPHDGYTALRWEVPLIDSLGGPGRWPGEISIRRSDGRISMTSVGSILETGDCARNLGVALIAAGEEWDRQKAAQQPCE